MAKKKDKNVGLIFFCILLLTLFFRLWKLQSFQYWSDDEQLVWFIIRHIVVDRHLSLVTPNAALELGFGPLFHYLLLPFFWLFRFDPQKIVLLGNVFALMSVVLFYKTGKLLAGTKVGLISAFLYATSFMASLFDRRLWALTPNVFILLLGIYSLIKVLRGHYKFTILLAIPVAFSFNSDPSLGVITLTIITTVILFKKNFKIKYLLTAGSLLLLLLLPIITFQLRHPINITKRIEVSANFDKNFIPNQLENFSRFFYTTKTKAADSYFCYCKLDETRPVLITLATFLILVYFVYLTWKQKNNDYLILLISILTYLFGIFIFKTFLKGSAEFFYAITISAPLFLIFAIVISKLNNIY
jgi:4-amino-4-deoxy-L-arabinose transferase-like glycosyltransferase